MRILWFTLTAMLMAVSAPAAQSQQDDIPLTFEAFSHLTAQEAARRLLGPSGELITHMLIGRSALDAGLLNAVRLYTKPKAVHPGLCHTTEMDVFLEQLNSAERRTTSTVMKISGLGSGQEFYVVGDLTAPFDDKTRSDTDEMCGVQANPFGVFRAANADFAWEAAFLFEAALRDIQMGGRQRFDSECSQPVCMYLYPYLPTLTAKAIQSVDAGCSERVEPTTVCYTVWLEGYRIYLEAVRDRTATSGPKLSFRHATFTPVPVVRI